PALSYSNHTLELFPNSSTAIFDGKSYKLTASPVLVQGRLLVPVRDISELMGVDVRWDNQARKAIVTFPYVPDLVSENQTLRDNLQDSLSYLQVLDDPQMQALVTTIKTIKEEYLYPEKTSTIAYAAAKGAVDSLRDPYSNFYDPSEAKQILEALQGAFVGIGVYLQESSSGVVIVKVVSGSPAQKAGLQAGDVIVKVDDVDVSSAPLEVISSLLKGDEGTFVKVTVRRADRTLTFTVQRRRIVVPTVSLNMNTTTVAVVQIDQFTDTTPSELRQAMSMVKAPKLVLDLRGNPGGLVESLVDIAGMFMGPKPVFMYRDNEQTTVISTKTPQIYTGKLYVLVDRYSASAAEMLAGALQDNKRATIVGERTFGKGVGQTLFDLDDGSLLYLTTFEFRTPNGKVINNYGIDPDIKVDPATALEYVLRLP
ncbi:MAG TPA: PDZ domain-containing protein, partial [Clostridiales bacterium]|nr:PDZ domain-containing protein [Clostridiales bacterium]